MDVFMIGNGFDLYDLSRDVHFIHGELDDSSKSKIVLGINADEADEIGSADTTFTQFKSIIQYCATASRWATANGYKEWRHLFIPAKHVLPNSTIKQIAERFIVI